MERTGGTSAATMAAACKGLVLVIDLWSGIGGLLVALLSLGVRCIALAAEQEPSLQAAVRQHFPHVGPLDRAKQSRDFSRSVCSPLAFQA